jgi:hypothetical protein
VTDHWIYPNPDYPDPADPKHIIHVDLDSREPLREEQAVALNAALSQQIKDREKLNKIIQKTSQRLVLSGEAKVQAMREKEDNGTQP